MAAAINEDGSKIAVALNDRNDLPYGVVHFYSLKEVKEYKAKNNQQTNQNSASDTEQSGFKVQINVDDNSLILNLNSNGDVTDYSVPEKSDTKIVEKFNRELVIGRGFADAITDILVAVNEAGYIKNGTNIEVLLVEIYDNPEFDYEELLSKVETKIKDYQEKTKIDFTYSVDEEY